MAAVYIIGAGLAGLACAVRLTRRGRHVSVFDSAPHAGGRCRSFFDRTLGQTIDNGNHLLFSANRSALAYLDEIGAADTLISPPRAVFPFVDLATGERWTVRPNRGPLPWWIISPSRRIPSTKPRHYLSGWRLAFASRDQTVEDCIDPHDPLFRRFWEPMT